MVTLDATEVQDENDLQEAQEAQEAQGATQAEVACMHCCGNGCDMCNGTGTLATLEESEVVAMLAELATTDEDQQPEEPEPGPVVAPASQGIAVTEEAQRAYNERKSYLEGIIGQLAIEQARLKAAVKRNRESLGDYTEQLESHINRGPERLPLFDRQTEAERAEGDGEQPTDTDDAPRPTEAASNGPGEISDTDPMPPDAVESFHAHMLATIEDGGITYGVKGTVVTAYADNEGDVFLAHWTGEPDEEGTECSTVYLIPEEYDRIEPAATPAPEASAVNSAESADSDESWRAERIDEALVKLGLTPGIAKILEGHEIVTMGDLADVPMRKGCDVSQLKGMTEKRLAKLDAATTAYWAAK